MRMVLCKLGLYEIITMSVHDLMAIARPKAVSLKIYHTVEEEFLFGCE